MNTNYKKVVWHTCSLRNSQNCEDIRDKVPFRSKAKYQWLTQGYYFWLDDDHAKDWGKIRRFERYAVSHFQLIFDDEKDIFDLRETKNLKHLAKIARTIEQAYEVKKQEPKNIRTVAHIIAFLRSRPSDDIFRGVAVLASDEGCLLKKEDPEIWKNSVPFTEKEDGSLSLEKLAITRNQLCVFDIGNNPKYEIYGMKEYKND